MRKLTLSFFFILAAGALMAQVDTVYSGEPISSISSVDLQKRKNAALNIGVLMGGGSLVGLDFEFMPVKRLGIQAGAGISSFGFGLNYHL